MADKNFKVKNNIIVNDVEIDPSSPSLNQILRFDGTKFASANSGIPSGGLEGQILSKITDTSFDTQWIDNYAGEIKVVCKNNTASQINKGVAVMSNSASGDTVNIAPAVANGSIEAKYMFGITSANIAAGSTGYVTLVGQLQGVNTNAYNVGTLLYIDPATPGGLTSSEPTAPNVNVAIAIVTTKHPTTGRLFIRIWNQGGRIDELQDVNTAGVTNNQILLYNSSTSVWASANIPPGTTIISDTAPPNPTAGNLWYKSNVSKLYIYYDSFWVQI